MTVPKNMGALPRWLIALSRCAKRWCGRVVKALGVGTSLRVCGFDLLLGVGVGVGISACTHSLSSQGWWCEWSVKQSNQKNEVLGGGGGGGKREIVGITQWLERRTRDRKGCGFESLLERRENFLLQGQLSVLTLVSVSVPPPCYRSST